MITFFSRFWLQNIVIKSSKKPYLSFWLYYYLLRCIRYCFIVTCFSVLVYWQKKKLYRTKTKKCGLSFFLNLLYFVTAIKISFQFCSFVPFFNLHFVHHEKKEYIANMRSFVDKIWRVYILLPKVFCNPPIPRLLTLSRFSKRT